MKLLIPVTLKRRSELGHRLALRAKTQADVDRIVRIFMPEWRGEQPDTSEPAVTKYDGKQSAGSYSLDLCQGGAHAYVQGHHDFRDDPPIR